MNIKNKGIILWGGISVMRKYHISVISLILYDTSLALLESSVGPGVLTANVIEIQCWCLTHIKINHNCAPWIAFRNVIEILSFHINILCPKLIICSWRWQYRKGFSWKPFPNFEATGGHTNHLKSSRDYEYPQETSWQSGSRSSSSSSSTSNSSSSNSTSNSSSNSSSIWNDRFTDRWTLTVATKNLQHPTTSNMWLYLWKQVEMVYLIVGVKPDSCSLCLPESKILLVTRSYTI